VKLFITVLLSPLLLFTKVLSDEVQSPVFMGVGVVKPSEIIRAQLPELPKGVGFVLESVKHSGPGERAGLQVHDVIFMLEDQLLINEGQLMALLGMRHDGETVTIRFFRAGKEEERDLTLESRQEVLRPSTPTSDELSLTSGLPLHTIDRQERTATISDDKGIYTMMMLGNEVWLRVETLTGELVFDGAVVTPEQVATVPSHCTNKLPILRRALKECIKDIASRRPRLRYVPPVKYKKEQTR